MMRALVVVPISRESGRCCRCVAACRGPGMLPDQCRCRRGDATWNSKEEEELEVEENEGEEEEEVDN